MRHLAAFILPLCLATSFAAAQSNAPAPANTDPRYAPGGVVDPNYHIEAPGQGAQDPQRAETLDGWSKDYPRCMERLKLRRMNPVESNDVCTKLLNQLGEHSVF